MALSRNAVQRLPAQPAPPTGLASQPHDGAHVPSGARVFVQVSFQVFFCVCVFSISTVLSRTVSSSWRPSPRTGRVKHRDKLTVGCFDFFVLLLLPLTVSRRGGEWEQHGRRGGAAACPARRWCRAARCSGRGGRPGRRGGRAGWAPGSAAGAWTRAQGTPWWTAASASPTARLGTPPRP